MVLELFLGLGMAASLATVTVGVERIRKTQIVSESQFQSKFDKLSASQSHLCYQCTEDIDLERVRLLFADNTGQVQVVCDKDECLFAHARGLEPNATLVAE